MSLSLFFLSVVLCIPIVLFSYFFYSIPCVNRWIRRGQGTFFDLRLAAVNLFFYFILFVLLEQAFLYFENISFFALSFAWQLIFFTCVSTLTLGALYCATGGLFIKGPRFYAEKLITVQGPYVRAYALFLQVLEAMQADIILDAIDKKIIIAQFPLSACGRACQEEVVVELTFSEALFGSLLVQMVCYSASRTGFVERVTMYSVLQHVELLYDKKFLESL